MRNLYLSQQEANQQFEQRYLNSVSTPSGDNNAASTAPCLPDMAPPDPQTELLSIVMPVWTGGEITAKALQAIIDHTKRPLEIIIIDNGSDATAKAAIDNFLSLHTGIARVIHNETNRGYPVACNQGLQASQGSYLVVMNNDVLVTPCWASRMMAAFTLDAGIGAVGPRTNFVSSNQLVRICHYTEANLNEWAGLWHAAYAGTLRITTRLIGFLMMIRRDLLDQIGGFDPVFGPGNCEDDDYCLRARLAGYRLLIADDVFVHHYGSQSFNKDPEAYSQLLKKNLGVFAAKWGIDLRCLPEHVISLDRCLHHLRIPLA
jgi:hypothetical protein